MRDSDTAPGDVRREIARDHGSIVRGPLHKGDGRALRQASVTWQRAVKFPL